MTNERVDESCDWASLRTRLLQEIPVTPSPSPDRGPRKPILCLDFDGVLHSYTSGWQGADVIPDPPVPSALDFLEKALEAFQVAIYSSRSHQRGGVQAMKAWLFKWGYELGKPRSLINRFLEITFPLEKPPAFLTLDDRALTFTGTWPSVEELQAFKPWYQRPASARVLDEIAAERRRQTGKGFTAGHDDTHTGGELLDAAICLAGSYSSIDLDWLWPFLEAPATYPGVRESLVYACALLVAEIERLDRLKAPGSLQ